MIQIVRLGERYKREFLASRWKDSLEADWYGGLSLLLSHSFYQGRTDEVSAMVEKAAMSVLNVRFKTANFTALENCDFNALWSDLSAVIGKGKIGKARDVLMIVGILKFVAGLPQENLAGYSVAEIRHGNIRKLYEDLMGIIQIGPKIASLYLRDLVDLYDLEAVLRPEDLQFLQPIDVWVRRVAFKMSIIDNEELPEDRIRRNIIIACHDNGVSALRFNQGAWYLGQYSLEILIENLDVIHASGD